MQESADLAKTISRQKHGHRNQTTESQQLHQHWHAGTAANIHAEFPHFSSEMQNFRKASRNRWFGCGVAASAAPTDAV